MPKVSIVVVNYNYSRYLDERIQSFLNQTYKDFELIIIDNGSTDNSVEIIDKYTKDPRISVKYFPENDLPFKRWNDAIDSTQGEYLLVAASDDSCHPCLLERLVEKLDAYPSVGIAFSQSWGIDEQGNKLYSWKEWTDDLDQERWSKDFVDNGKNECQYLFFKCTIPNPSGALLRRSTFFEAGKFDIKLQLCVDMMMWAKMLTISDIAYIAEPLNYFRQPTHGISLRLTIGETPKELEEKLRVFHYILQVVEAPSSFWETVYNQLINWWMGIVVFGKTSFSTNLRIYKLFKSIDPAINRQLFRNLISVLQRKFSSALSQPVMRKS